ncbi:hypothetical protein NS274_10655 [Pseudomonas oryzihabitans]|uniref:Uncharacterized protein n=1 Tax=Pseudomonas oryzihabitans TaxID=47885 RepID=A0AAJ2EZQ0_9PSED|nr:MULTISPECIES: hypothetical protein [Pseudomonas]APQ12855.1 hypothetical protein BJP27_15580 [Pseudomonas psychrotolerans]KTS77539.1 hypothetical protein NS274_10655 [Pseudomonas psychrotolerans]KTT04850.1 hypothetical protein NS376_02330 [Pseudomonas psychrotolerans]KTT13939.1 hypothetical protein NS2R_02320 [Pseudomonas psychrotolerans]KTT26312.1 hypothetical protein SB14R_03880 [Pseudomonas psychrotolerans]
MRYYLPVWTGVAGCLAFAQAQLPWLAVASLLVSWSFLLFSHDNSRNSAWHSKISTLPVDPRFSFQSHQRH